MRARVSGSGRKLDARATRSPIRWGAVALTAVAAVAAAATVSSIRKLPVFASNYGRTGSSENGSTSWIAGALALPAAGLVQLLPLVPIIIFYFIF
jgi:hypothetical protein